MATDTAQSWLQRLGQYHPRLIEAAVAMNENRLHDAEPLLRQHLKDDPFDVAAIRMFAELAGRIGRYKDSETLLRRALEISPAFTAARANLALVLYRLNRPEEAIAELDRVTAEEPDNPGHANLQAAHRRRRHHTARIPGAFADQAVAGDDPADKRDQRTDGEVGDIRGADPDPARHRDSA